MPAKDAKWKAAKSYVPGCPVEATLNLIDGKWKGVILYHLQGGTRRFGELKRQMPGVTQRMLTKQLRALEDDGLILRKVYPEVPPRVEYRLSDLGEGLKPVIEALRVWGVDYCARQNAQVPDRTAYGQEAGVVA